VDIKVASDLTSIPSGRASDVVFSITNYGPSDTFSLAAKDSQGFIVAAPSSPILLAAGATASATVRLSPPLSTALDAEVAVSLTATGTTTDAANSATRILAVAEPNSAPLCSAASASPAVIRAVNHKMVDVSIIGVTDADNDPVAVSITSIVQSEPVTGAGSGNTRVDATGIGQSRAQVRAERSGKGNGRLYRIGFDATDGKGGSCSGSVTVEVPHDHRASAWESGRYYFSTAN